LLGVAKPVRPDQDDRRLRRIEGLLQPTNPRQPGREAPPIKEGQKPTALISRPATVDHARDEDEG
jgi:hypothetical protein